jgi:methyl-accepting chemotaxis protein
MILKRLSLTQRLVAMHMMMFLLALVTVAVVAWGWSSLSGYRYFVTEEGRTVDVFQGNHLQQRYTPWKEAAQRAIASRKAADYQAFEKRNTDYKTSLELMLKQSGSADWQETLQTSLSKLAAFDESLESLKAIDQVDLRLPPAPKKDTKEPVSDLEDSIKAALSQLGPKDAALQDRLLDFQLVLTKAKLAMLRYQAFENPSDLALVREHFLTLDDSILQMQQNAPEKMKPSLDALGKNISAFFGEFETLAGSIQERTALVATLNGDFLDNDAVNPLVGLSWSVLKPKGSERLIERFNKVSMLLVLSALFSIGVAVFAFFYIQRMLEKPLRALTSYTSHAFLTRKRTEVPGHARHDEIGVLARAIQALLVHIDQKIEEEAKRTLSNPTTAPVMTAQGAVSGVAVPLGGMASEKSEELALLLEEVFGFTDDFMRRKTFDHAKSVETGELADQTRQSIQKAALNIHDMMTEYQDMATLCGQILRKMGRHHQETKRLDVKLYNLSMATDRFQDLIRALQGFCQDVAMMQHNLTLVSYHEPEKAVEQATHQFSQIRQQYDEVSLTLAHEAGILTGYLQACHETVKSLHKNNESLQTDTQQLSTHLSQSPAGLKALYEMLQAVSFRIGRLAVVLLEHSADAVKSNAAVHRLSSLAKDLRRFLGQALSPKTPANPAPSPSSSPSPSPVAVPAAQVSASSSFSPSSSS